MKTNCRQAKGFTLVELAFSVAMVGALASMSLGVFYSYQDKTRTVEMDMVLHEVRNSSFLVMQSLVSSIANPVCLWEYDPSDGGQNLVCNTETGQNVLMDLFQIKDARLVIFSTFNAITSTGDWTHTTSIFHCDIAEGNNQIDYQNTSDGSYFNVRSRTDPAVFSTQCT